MAGTSALDDELRTSPVVRLRGLPFHATEEDIKNFFSGLSMVPDGVAIQMNFQGKSSGQAFVEFVDAEQANKALERNRQHIGSRYIEVFKGHVADMEGALRMLGRERGSAGGAGGRGASAVAGLGAAGMGAAGGMGMFSAAAAPPPPGVPGLTGMDAGVPGAGGATDMRYAGVLRMRGMPYSATPADVTAFFKGMAIAPNGIFLLTHPDGRPKGEAFVEFADEESAQRAMQLHREPMGSRYVELFRSNKGEMMTAVNQRMYGMFGGGAAAGGMGGRGMMSFGVPAMANVAAMQPVNPYAAQAVAPSGVGLQSMPLGAAAQAVAVSGAGVADNVCLKMRGLPFSASVLDILEFFKGYNVVENGVHIVMGPGERPTGEAYVEFATPEDAQRAMEKHRQHVGSRYVELFRVTKSEALMAVQGGAMANFNMAAAMDPNMQLLLLQQQQLQAALGMGGASGAGGQWGGMGRPM